jgi:hypothetical protein
MTRPVGQSLLDGRHGLVGRAEIDDLGLEAPLAQIAEPIGVGIESDVGHPQIADGVGDRPVATAHVDDHAVRPGGELLHQSQDVLVDRVVGQGELVAVRHRRTRTGAWQSRFR